MATTGHGALWMLTGGTTKLPRAVVYSAANYKRSVAATALFLRHHGVGGNAAVVVAFPSDPWAIGGIFRDASLQLGARVLPIGCQVVSPALNAVLVAFGATHVAGPVGVLCRADAAAAAVRGASHQSLTILHAGEPLRSKERERCAELWRAEVFNVYGTAEFDSVACELRSRDGLALLPHLEYRIQEPSTSRHAKLRDGIEGCLVIRGLRSDEWLSTGDRVRVHRAVPGSVPWPVPWRIEVLGRTDYNLKLPAGATVLAAHIDEVATQLGGIGVQLQYVNEQADARPQVRLVLVSEGNGDEIASRARVSLLSTCLELSDEVAGGSVDLHVVCGTADSVFRTARGKVPPIWKVAVP